jgi:ArsR family transcriptional regulator
MFASFRLFEYSPALMNQVRQFKASIFQALAHPTRIQILEVLRQGELPVNAILARVERDQANVSQHLATLRLRGLVANRKEGNQVFYSVRDPLLFEVLDLMRRFSTAHLREHLALLEQFKAEAPSAPTAPGGGLWTREEGA